MAMIKITPTSLRAYLACKRSWYLAHVARAPKIVPPYVVGGRKLDVAVQTYLQGPPGADGPDLDAVTRAELDVMRAELPSPGTVRVQHRMSAPCPGLEGLVVVEATADYTTPPNAGLVVIGDAKRVWHSEAIMTPAQLADDVQAQTEAWLVWANEAPSEVIWRWSYCVRATVNAQGVMTRKPRAESTDAKADRARVDAWFERVLLPAARGMLEITGPVEGIEHDPDSCENGNRCFVRASCPLHIGPVKGEIMVDLSKFRTNAKVAAQAIVAEAAGVPLAEDRAARIAINPPAPQVIDLGAALRASLAISPKDQSPAGCQPALAGSSSVPTPTAATRTESVAQSVPAESGITLDTPSPMLDVQTLEGPGAELLEVVPEAPETIPAPAPAEDKPVRKRTRRTEGATVSADEWRVTEQARADFEAECARVNAELEDLRARNARQAEMLEFSVEGASTEALRDELIDRGYRVWLEARA